MVRRGRWTVLPIARHPMGGAQLQMVPFAFGPSCAQRGNRA